MKKPRIFIIILCSIFWLSACSSVKPKPDINPYSHYSVGEPTDLRVLPADMQGKLVIYHANGTKEVKVNQSAAVDYRSSTTATGWEQSTLNWLDQEIRREESEGKELIGITAFYPTVNLPSDHLGYRMKELLNRERNKNVFVAPHLNNGAGKEHIKLIFQ